MQGFLLVSGLLEEVGDQCKQHAILFFHSYLLNW